MAINEVLESNTPDEGRVIFNDNDAYLDGELIKKVANDGTVPFTANQSMGNNRLIDVLTDPDSPKDAVNVSTLRQGLGILSKLKYVSVSNSHTFEKYLYADDGTTVIGYGVDTIEKAFAKCDGTSWWTIQVESDYSCGVEDWNNSTNYIKLIGIGKPEVRFSGDMTNYFYTENIKFNTTQASTHIARSRFEDSDIGFYDDRDALPRSLLLDDKVVIKNCNLVTNSNGAIVLGTGGLFFIHNNILSVDLTGDGANDSNASNLISTNLKARLEEVYPDV